ncbi:MAG: hybrid sensor histidine kinase/response regulator [Gammaproteobacteria bacterium]|nr:hybrid sensor histidine kinase/response regulator [Gammaproteobacteria bacterium]
MPSTPKTLHHTANSREGKATAGELDATARKVAVGFAFALACLGVVGLVSYLSVVRLNENAAWVAHTHEVLSRLESLIAGATDSETAERGYVITGDETYLEPYQKSAALVEDQAQRLRELTADNPAQTQRLDSIVPLVTERLASLRAVIELRKSQGFAAAQGEILSGKGKRFHDRIRRLIDEMKKAETALLSEREQRANRSSTVAKGVIVGGGFLGCGLVGLALFAIRRDFAGRALAEGALRDAKDQLEVRVQQRTAQLAKAAEENAQLASIIEFSDDAIVSKDLDGVITSWNPGAERLFGYSSQESVGKPMAMLIPPERSSEEPTILGRIARGETTDPFETVRVRKDGTKIDVSVTISPIRDDRGLIVGVSKIARDITERRLAQAKVHAQLARLSLLQHITRAIGERQDIQSIFQVVIRTLEEQLPVDFCCICLYDPAENCVIVTSVGSRSEALAMELAMTKQARIEIDQNGLSHCVRGRLVYEPDITSVPFPFAQRLARGTLRAMVAAPLLVESKVFGVLIAARQQSHSFSSGECEFVRQVSEHVALAAHQVQLYGALQQAYDDLRQTQKAVMQQERLLALGQMASGIAHDINNAISPVALYTESLLEREPGLSPRARSHLETIQRAIDDVAQTVARMREFYRQREPQSTLVPVDMNALVRQIVDLTRARWSDMAQRRGIAIEMRTDLAPGLPTILGADNEIREALTNLIFNAVDAMPNGGPLTLRTRVVQDEEARSQESSTRESVQLEVVDAGIGMDEETRRRCLEPFFTTKGERGTGLGLAMVYGAIQRHSANIEIESAVGQGTTIRLSFPIPTAPTAGAEVSAGAGVVPPLRVLVVDDDPLVLESLRETLTADGHGVTTADGGQAGIDTFLAARAQGNPFPVVITDLGMPYVDGRRVSSAIKTAAPETIVLMLTGWGQRLVAEGDIPPHVDHVLSKPPKMRALREALAQCLDARPS